MSHDYVACSKSLDCLFGLLALGKINFLVQFRIVRAQVPLSGEETGSQYYIAAVGIYPYGAALKSDTSSRGMY
ncbi:hypothetical protein TNCV_3085651 [Trichonephila clavipes]|nr:hypothetical protein TNCV_3085651 [Trichonephila clavipes]